MSVVPILMSFFVMKTCFPCRENKAKGGGICVANHTSPIDAILLACDNCYALVGVIKKFLASVSLLFSSTHMNMISIVGLFIELKTAIIFL